MRYAARRPIKNKVTISAKNLLCLYLCHWNSYNSISFGSVLSTDFSRNFGFSEALILICVSWFLSVMKGCHNFKHWKLLYSIRVRLFIDSAVLAPPSAVILVYGDFTNTSKENCTVMLQTIETGYTLHRNTFSAGKHIPEFGWARLFILNEIFKIKFHYARTSQNGPNLITFCPEQHGRFLGTFMLCFITFNITLFNFPLYTGQKVSDQNSEVDLSEKLNWMILRLYL